MRANSNVLGEQSTSSWVAGVKRLRLPPVRLTLVVHRIVRWEELNSCICAGELN
ncbi:hypothetical protein Plim_0846 [Planctopirus limnophila DSM 3776]|uniref:Uncharacterized protein n=1 Tax=Planctopirus limnophila (strain ATCC 43296 / DSM 3776 / IFAM 1008 / Mu 290) TaxID=521674 RepID=D5SSE2_PLAL2|nr:hypothetical protein Plim_0846 [Planctopirus limnophila DSM 3776]